jgi:hypothetical protein
MMRNLVVALAFVTALSGCFQQKTYMEKTYAGRAPAGGFDPSSRPANSLLAAGETTYVADVVKFGAKCDADPVDTWAASSDDTPFIQAAINSVSKRGGIVLFPPRICAIGSTLRVPPYVTLQGQGRLTSRIHLRSKDVNRVALDLTGANHVVIRDIAIWVSWEGQIGVDAASAKELIINNVSFVSSQFPGVGQGLYLHRKRQDLDGAVFVRVSNSNFENLVVGARVGTSEDAQLFTLTPEDAKVEEEKWIRAGRPAGGPGKPSTSANAARFTDCKFTSNRTGLVIENVNSVDVMNSYFEDNSAYGIATWTDPYSAVYNLLVQGSYFESNKLGSIILTNRVEIATLAFNHYSTDVDSANSGQPILTGSHTMVLGGKNSDYPLQP